MDNYLFELHAHTKETSLCGKVYAEELIKRYSESGFDGVCITDHFSASFFNRRKSMPWKAKVDAYLKGFRKAREIGEELKVPVILGMEYCLPKTRNDILIYGFDEEFLYYHENLYLFDEEALKDLAKANNLLLIQAHPYRKRTSKRHNSLVDGFEAYNSHPRHNSRNRLATKHAKEFGGIITAGSDVHRVEDIGRAGVYLPRLPLDSHNLAQVLREVKAPRMHIQGE